MTASKAIIEKEYQPKVIVSKQGPNPFNKLTDQELDEYRKEVEQKQKGTEGNCDEFRKSKECVHGHSPRNRKQIQVFGSVFSENGCLYILIAVGPIL